MYQDVWIKGEVAQKGYRDCAKRYSVIQEYCADRFNPGFSVLDIGANTCYFGIRLIEDFNCRVMAFEFNSFEKRNEIVKRNGLEDKLIFIKRKLSLNDIVAMDGLFKPDLILALSVLHHVKSPELWVEQLRRVSDTVIVEFAKEDSARVEKGFTPPEGFNLLGYGSSHLNKEIKRPILAYERN